MPVQVEVRVVVQVVEVVCQSLVGSQEFVLVDLVTEFVEVGWFLTRF